jgi:hypothetical protein
MDDANDEAFSLADDFRYLADKWIAETAHISVTADAAMHPSYQRIIGLGVRVLPYIFAEMETSPRRWFWALRYITGENPASPEIAGNVQKIAAAWREWGLSRGWVH